MAENEVKWMPHEGREEEKERRRYPEYGEEREGKRWYDREYGSGRDCMTDQYIMHVIQPGNTFFCLSKAYGVPVDEIIKANPCAVPENLQIGQIVKIPCMMHRPKEDHKGGHHMKDPEYYSKKK